MTPLDPALLPREAVLEAFVVREPQLRELDALVRRAPADGSPQHALVLGGPGMGKTLLLHRLACLVEDELGARWLPVRLDDAHYDVGDLADLWLKALRAVGERAAAEALSREHEGSALEEAARRALHDAAVLLDRRLLLLVDGFDALLERIDDDLQQARLREVLQHAPWLMLVGAASGAIEATYHYDRPLYDQLAVVALGPLGEEEVEQVLGEAPGPLRPLLDTPRAARMLREVRRASQGLRLDLERLLDLHAPLFRARMEALPNQTQRVLDALARGWEAATAEEIADRTRLGRAPASAQLTRLMDRGLVERVDVGQRAVGYQVRDRLFALWCLARGGERERLGAFADWIERFEPPVEPPPQDEPALLEAARGAHERRAEAPDRWEAHVGVAVAEARLGRDDPAAEALEGALRRAEAAATPLIACAIAVARVAPARTLEALERTGWTERMLPLADALRLAADEAFALRLPAERRAAAAALGG